MGLPYFFQKFEFRIQVKGLPGVGKKLFLDHIMTEIHIQRGDFQLDIYSPDGDFAKDYETWIINILEKDKLTQGKERKEKLLRVHFSTRKELDKLLELVLLRNGGISVNTALPEGMAWNPEKFPPAVIVPEENSRFKLETTKGKWLVSFPFSPGLLKQRIHFPEDIVEMKAFCKRNNLEIHEVPFSGNLLELSYGDWDLLAEKLLN